MTLERALIVALVLHALGLYLADRWQSVLFPLPAPVEQTQPIEFRFVDTPDTPVVEPPDTPTMSDIDRRAADASPRDDAADPFSEGNTPQPVLRAPEPSAPAIETPPAQPLVQPSEAVASADPITEPVEEGETPAETTAEGAASTAPEAAAVDPSPASLPPRPADLRQSLTRLESFVDEQVFENRSGGAQEPGSLAQFDTRGYDLGPYLRQVLRRIETNWRSNIPPLIRTGVGGATFVGLSIRRELRPDGSEVAFIVATRTWQSGQPAYDSAALFSLELSNPLPPIPAFYPHDEITGRLGFLYNMDPEKVAFPEGQ